MTSLHCNSRFLDCHNCRCILRIAITIFSLRCRFIIAVDIGHFKGAKRAVWVTSALLDFWGVALRVLIFPSHCVGPEFLDVFIILGIRRVHPADIPLALLNILRLVFLERESIVIVDVVVILLFLEGRKFLLLLRSHWVCSKSVLVFFIFRYLPASPALLLPLLFQVLLNKLNQRLAHTHVLKNENLSKFSKLKWQQRGR